MLEEFGRSGSQVERAAVWRLAAAEASPVLPPADSSAVILRLLRFEGLGRYYVWAVLRGEQFAVRRIIWDRPNDVRPGAVEPTTFGSHAPIAVQLLEPQLVALHSLTLRP